MKNNKIHALLGIITEPGTESKENWRYDELPGKLGIPEIEIMGYCDILEKVPLLLAQRQHEGYFSRSYQNCRKAYLTGLYKEDEPTVTKVEMVPTRKTLLGRSYTLAGIIGGFASGGLLAFTIITYINDGRLEVAKQQHQTDIKQIEQQGGKIDSLQNLLDASTLNVQKLNLKIDSLSQSIMLKK
ncbi:MAG: hypothetical protein AABY93_18020 [Bacteroidota bacterium]